MPSVWPRENHSKRDSKHCLQLKLNLGCSMRNIKVGVEEMLGFLGATA